MLIPLEVQRRGKTVDHDDGGATPRTGHPLTRSLHTVHHLLAIPPRHPPPAAPRRRGRVVLVKDSCQRTSRLPATMSGSSESGGATEVGRRRAVLWRSWWPPRRSPHTRVLDVLRKGRVSW